MYLLEAIAGLCSVLLCFRIASRSWLTLGSSAKKSVKTFGLVVSATFLAQQSFAEETKVGVNCSWTSMGQFRAVPLETPESGGAFASSHMPKPGLDATEAAVVFTSFSGAQHFITSLDGPLKSSHVIVFADGTATRTQIWDIPDRLVHFSTGSCEVLR